MARGAVKKIAERSQSSNEPGPACAAGEIQRLPTMQAMANSVTSRSTSSRRSVGEADGFESGIVASIHYRL